MADKFDNDQLQQFADFIIAQMDERFAEQDRKMSERFAEQDKSIEQGLGVAVEKIEDQVAIAVQNIDDRIERHIAPFKADVENLQKRMTIVEDVVKATNRDLKKTNKTLESLAKTVASLQKTIDANSKQIQSLDVAVGNVEHRVDLALTFANSALGQSSRTKKLIEQVDNHEHRLTKIEAL
jgi:chromosome segregation ATPase